MPAEKKKPKNRTKAQKKNPGWRPSKKKEAVEKLVEAFKMDCNISQACSYAWIDRQTFYNRIEKDKKFFGKIESAKERPLIRSKKTVMNSIDEGNWRAALEVMSKRDDKYKNSWTIESNDKSFWASMDKINDALSI